MKLSVPNILLLVICATVTISIFVLNAINTNDTGTFDASVKTLSAKDDGLLLLQNSKDELFLAENEYQLFLSSGDKRNQQEFLLHINNFIGNLSRIDSLPEGYLNEIRKQVKGKLDLALFIAVLKQTADTLLVNAKYETPSLSTDNFINNADTLKLATLEKYFSSLVDTVRMVSVKQKKGFFKKVGELFSRNKKDDSLQIQHNEALIAQGSSKDSVSSIAKASSKNTMKLLSGKINSYYRKVIARQLALRKKIDESEKMFAQKTLGLISKIKLQTNLLLTEINMLHQQHVDAAAANVLKLQNKKDTVFRTSLIIIGCTVLLLFYSIYKAVLYEKDIIEEKQKAQNLAALKARFLSRMSHEIRSPLTTVIGFTEYMQKNGNDKDAPRYLNAIKVASDHLLSTVNDVLDYSKLEAGKIKLTEEPFALRRLLDETVSVYSLDAQNRNLQLKLHCLFDEKLVLCGDAFRLKQVLYNLTGNAIKFTDAGFVEVSANIKELSNGNLMAEFKVSDTGIGIPAGQFDYIFEEFTQVKGYEKKAARSSAGTGLGLSICKMLVELQGGIIKVQSEPGKGSVFSFSIPYKVSNNKMTATEEQYNDDNELPTFSGKRILVVEDSDFNIMLLSLFLTRYNLQFDIAKDGETALNLFNKTKYDLVLTDIHVPKLSGYELAGAIRKLDDKDKASVTVIALTANPVGEDFNFYYEQGINDIITKPFKEIDLRNKLAIYFTADVDKTQAIKPV